MGIFTEKTALVTGGAGVIGSQIVTMLYQEGANVVFCDWNEEAGARLTEKLEGDPKRLVFLPCDVCRSEEARRVTDAAVERFGRLDFLVTVAGGSTRANGRCFYKQADRISNAELAERCFLSPSAFYSAFKQATGCTPVEYKNRLKVRMAMELLMNTSESLECICRRTGFSSPAYLRRVMYRYTGRKPHEIRQGRGALC